LNFSFQIELVDGVARHEPVDGDYGLAEIGDLRRLAGAPPVDCLCPGDFGCRQLPNFCADDSDL
jgi:hypothetical protein